jgi:hypothetical protein
MFGKIRLYFFLPIYISRREFPNYKKRKLYLQLKLRKKVFLLLKETNCVLYRKDFKLSSKCQQKKIFDAAS